MITDNLKEDLPVPYHETFDVIDSSKIQTFMDCPRKFFFRYVLGLQPDTPDVHLVFGSAWHKGMEHFMKHGLEEEEVYFAYDKFKNEFMREYPVQFAEEQHRSKNLENASDALVEYAQKWRPVDNFETLYTEIAGTVPIDDDTLLFAKLDTIIRDEDGYVWSMEHKTTGRKSSNWMTKWTNKVQVFTYSHFLNVLFPDEAEGIKINGAILRKSSNEFLRIPVRLSNQQMRQMLWEVKHWILQIRWNFEQLARCSRDDDIMTAFPRNGESCNKFGCPHPELCNLKPNPLKDQDRIPNGYQKEYWDPRRREDDANAVAHLEKENEIKTQKD